VGVAALLGAAAGLDQYTIDQYTRSMLLLLLLPVAYSSCILMELVKAE